LPVVQFMKVFTWPVVPVRTQRGNRIFMICWNNKQDIECCRSIIMRTKWVDVFPSKRTRGRAHAIIQDSWKNWWERLIIILHPSRILSRMTLALIGSFHESRPISLSGACHDTLCTLIKKICKINIVEIPLL
jgi:hypothetical protein